MILVIRHRSPRVSSLPMLSPQERHLLIAIALLLLMGGLVKSCRSRTVEADLPRQPAPATLPESPAEPAGQAPD